MQGKTHLAAGITAGLVLARYQGHTDISALAVSASVAGIAALVPDWLQINIPNINKSIKGFSGHRGFSHWLLTAWIAAQAVAVLFTHPAYNIPPVVFVGWVSHIVLDMFSGGVPVLWPLAGRVTLAHIKTGGKIDSFTGGAALVISCLLFFSSIF